MRSEFLIGSPGTAPRPRRWWSRFARPAVTARKASNPADDRGPAVVTGEFLLALVVIGAVFVAVGTWRVHSVFALRDREMETRRLQDIAQQRRDHFHALEGRLSQLQRTAVLREAGINNLGLQPASASELSVLPVKADAIDRWQRAAGEVNRKAP